MDLSAAHLRVHLHSGAVNEVHAFVVLGGHAVVYVASVFGCQAALARCCCWGCMSSAGAQVCSAGVLCPMN